MKKIIKDTIFAAIICCIYVLFCFTLAYFSPSLGCTFFTARSYLYESCVEGMQKRKNDREMLVLAKRTQIYIGSQTLFVEVADTIPKITLGLGQRDTLGSEGMLFVMPGKSVPMFWMKDMRFDLDFVWIDTNKVVDLTENVSAQQGKPDYKLEIYSPRSPTTHVLEMNSGEIKKRGIKIGDEVKL